MNNAAPQARGLASLPPDYHVHLPFCKHASGSPEAYRQTAGQHGLLEIGFADHAPSPTGYDPENRMAMDEFPAYLETVRRLQDGASPPVRLGIEADYHTGCETFLRAWLPHQPFDYVLGSVHYLGDWGFDNPDHLATWKSVDVKGVWRTYFAHVRRLIGLRLFDAVAHLDLPKKFGHRLRDRDLKEFVQPVLDDLLAANMVLEVNTGGLRWPAAEIYPAPLILELARERELRVCFGSDAHEPARVGAAFAEAVALLHSLGFTHCVCFRARQAEPVPLPAGRR